MEKKKNLRKIKVAATVIISMTLFGLLVLQIWITYSGLSSMHSALMYWPILFGWILLILIHKLKSNISLVFAFVFFALAAFATTFGFENIAESFMKISFIGWLVGIAQALVEYKKHETNKASS